MAIFVVVDMALVTVVVGTGSDCQGLAKPQGLEGRVRRVRVRVGILVRYASVGYSDNDCICAYL